MSLKSSESITRDNLFSAANQVQPIVTMPVTVASGEGALARGTILAVADASPNSGNLKILGTEGYGTPVCVLAEAVDATSANVSAVGYCTGEFNASQLIVNSGSTVASYVHALSRIGIFAK